MKKQLLLLCSNLCILSFNAQVCFNTGVNYPVGYIFGYTADPNAISSADYNGDGFLDLVTITQTPGGGGFLSVLLGNGNGTFSPASTSGAGKFNSIISADFNADGIQDLAATCNASGIMSVNWTLGNGIGGFGTWQSSSLGSAGPVSLVAVDINSDGKLDIATANQNSNNISILIGSGAGSFASAVYIAVSSGPVDITAADFNGDGKIDIATANYGSNNITRLLGNGSGGFGVAANFALNSQPTAIVSHDFNGDGKPDIATTNTYSSNISVLLGTGSTGNFSAVNNIALSFTPRSLTKADFNGDGKEDLATTNSVSNIAVLLGNGVGAFGPEILFPTPANGSSIAIAKDFNGDGKSDIVTMNSTFDDNVSILLNCFSPTNLTENSFTTNLSIYPNPAFSQLTVKSEITLGTITLTNLLGSVVYKENVKENETNIDVSKLTTGVYFVETILNEKRNVSKLVKE